jgi:hypothetical protein
MATEKKTTSKKTTSKKTTKSETKPRKTAKRNTRRDLIRELKNKRNEIDVEITNISAVRCKYVEEKTKYKYFDLRMGDKEILTLADLQEVVNRCRFMFEDHYLLITDVIMVDEEDDKKYTIDDLLVYLGLMDIYVDIDNHQIDYIEELIYDSEIKDFKNVVSRSDRPLLISIAGRMLSVFKQDPDEIDRNKIEIISSKLNLGDIFRENWM